jgi:adenylosuccinate lyase
LFHNDLSTVAIPMVTKPGPEVYILSGYLPSAHDKPQKGDSMIDRYTRPEMGALWTLENRLQVWLEVELSVCRAWHSLGVIDDATMNTIAEKADFDVDRVLAIEEETRHDVIAFLTAVEEKVGPASRFIHLGCTSSDIVDTANAICWCAPET